ncbi:tetratricopeptide repeat protein [Chloroflexota bacterium]
METKRTAILLAVLIGFWAWLYTYGKDTWKFWVCFAINMLAFVFCALAVSSAEGEGRAYSLIGAVELLFIVWSATWLFAVLDAVIKSPKRYGIRKGNWDRKRWFHVLVISSSITILAFGIAKIPTVIPTHNKYPEESAEWYFEKAQESIFKSSSPMMKASSTDEERRVYLRDAIPYLDEAVKLDPNNPGYFYFRGRTHYSLGENELALDDLNKAIELAIDYDGSDYEYMSVVILTKEEFEEIFYFQRSLIYRELGMKDEALNKWIETLWNDPANKIENYLDDEKEAWAINQAMKP